MTQTLLFESVTVYSEGNLKGDSKISMQKCQNCEEPGTHEIYKREQLTYQITEDLILSRSVKKVSHYLCKNCFTEIWENKCNYCGSAKVKRMVPDLELVCRECGSVLGSYIPEPKPKELQRYGTVNKPGYDSEFNSIYDETLKNYPMGWLSYISIDDFIIVITPVKGLLGSSLQESHSI